MRIMGHRGAGGLAMENTEKSLQKALELGVDSVEIDIRKTKDNQLVLCHDDNLMRTASNPAKVKDLSLKQIKTIKLSDGSAILSLDEALEVLGQMPVVIELKDSGCARILLQTIKNHPRSHPSVASFMLSELALIREMDKDIPLYGLEQTKPFDILHLAKIFKLSGIGLNYWLLNPLTYFRGKHSKLDIYVYTVNHRYTFWFIKIFYPGVTVCTNFPDRFISRRKKKKLSLPT